MAKRDIRAETIAEAGETLTDSIPVALEVLIEIMKATKPARNSMLRMKAATELLNRAGLPAVASSEIKGGDGQPLEIIIRNVLDKKP